MIFKECRQKKPRENSEELIIKKRTLCVGHLDSGHTVFEIREIRKKISLNSEIEAAISETVQRPCILP